MRKCSRKRGHLGDLQLFLSIKNFQKYYTAFLYYMRFLKQILDKYRKSKKRVSR